MTELIAYLTTIFKLIAGGGAVFAGGSFIYGAFFWLQGDRERGKSHINHVLIGLGILLCAAALGSAAAAGHP